MTLLGWRVVHDGKTPPPGEVVRPDERLSWPRTIGLGAQHVVAMFGATFVFPIVIGLNLAPVVANIYWPQDQWVALLTMLAVMAMALGFRGFLGRIAVFLGLIFGYLLSWIFDLVFGKINSYDPVAGKVTLHDRVNWAGVKSAGWFGFPPHTSIGPDGEEIPGWHLPHLNAVVILLVLPAVIAL